MIGLFGGTFDPIHFGHLRVALEVAETVGLEQVRFIPNRVPPHRRQPLASGTQRLSMIQAAIANEPRFLADDRELRKSATSYTVHTLQELHAEFPDESWAFIIGADAFLNFTTWHEWQTLLTLTHLIVVGRPGYVLPEANSDQAAWFQPYQVTTLSALNAQAAGGILALGIQGLDISATRVRKILEKGQNPRYLTPDAVCAMIKAQQLYTQKV